MGQVELLHKYLPVQARLGWSTFDRVYYTNKYHNCQCIYTNIYSFKYRFII
jgi:hypothetical protein